MANESKLDVDALLASLSKQDWSGLSHNFGPADDIPDLFASFIAREHPPNYNLEFALCYEGAIAEAAPQALPALMRFALSEHPAKGTRSSSSATSCTPLAGGIDARRTTRSGPRRILCPTRSGRASSWSSRFPTRRPSCMRRSGSTSSTVESKSRSMPGWKRPSPATRRFGSSRSTCWPRTATTQDAARPARSLAMFGPDLLTSLPDSSSAPSAARTRSIGARHQSRKTTMRVAPNPLNISDYLTAVEQNTVRINRDYQRSGNIWSRAAKSFLIETVVLGFPMPALYLHERYDREIRKPFKDIVDGQQRTETLREFMDGEFRLSRSLETESLRGRKFESLEEEDHEAFLSYSLPIFHLQVASDREVREAFRRINSYNASLKPEEKRHAAFQGPFKLFIHAVSQEIQESLIEWGVCSKAEVNRMKDTWLVAEIVYAFENGLQTTKAAQLDKMYKDYEQQYEEYEKSEGSDEDDGPFDFSELHSRVLKALEQIAKWDWLPGSALAKKYQFHILVMATMHAQRSVEALQPICEGGTGVAKDVRTPVSRILRALDDVETVLETARLEDEGDEDALDGYVEYRDLTDLRGFLQASSGSTNTQQTRETRFRTLFGAISRS